MVARNYLDIAQNYLLRIARGPEYMTWLVHLSLTIWQRQPALFSRHNASVWSMLKGAIEIQVSNLQRVKVRLLQPVSWAGLSKNTEWLSPVALSPVQNYTKYTAHPSQTQLWFRRPQSNRLKPHPIRFKKNATPTRRFLWKRSMIYLPNIQISARNCSTSTNRHSNRNGRSLGRATACTQTTNDVLSGIIIIAAGLGLQRKGSIVG